MRINFEVEITTDFAPIRITKKLLKELGDDVEGAVADHDSIASNAVECVSVRLVPDGKIGA